jgi:hypothetical protein
MSISFLKNFKANGTYRSGCLRRFGRPDKGFAQHRFRRKRDQGGQNVPEQRSGNERSD